MHTSLGRPAFALYCVLVFCCVRWGQGEGGGRGRKGGGMWGEVEEGGRVKEGGRIEEEEEGGGRAKGWRREEG